jgi:eukaryotic-like serine/threonine-protein kinase
VTLFEALFGRRPFAAPSVEALAAAKSQATFTSRPPRSTIPTALWRVVTRGLAPVPSDRWPSMTALVDTLERSAKPRRRLASGTLVVSAVASATVLAVWGATAIGHTRAMAACDAEADSMDEVWSAKRSEDIAAALDATGVPYATDAWIRARARIQDFADAWKETRRNICKAADVDATMTESMATASRACLHESRETLDALLAQFAEADAEVVPKVATATASLPLLSACAEEASLRHRVAQPNDPDVRERTRAVRARLMQAAAANMTGRHALAFELADAALQEARRDAQPLLVAEANLLVGIAETGLGRYEEGRQALEAAFFGASAAGDDVLALRAASWLVVTVGDRLARHREGLQWEREANTLLTRLNHADDLSAAGLLANTANIHFAQGDYEQARQLAQRALDIKQEILGPDHPELANALNTVGAILFRQGEHDEALRLHERALAIQEKTLGSMHPDVGITFSNIATVYYARSDHVNALAMFERTLALWRASLGEDHPRVAAALSNAAAVYQSLDAPDEARKRYEDALAIQEKNLQPDHPNIGSVLMNLANVHVSLGEQTRAQGLYLRALAIFEKSLGPEHPEVARTLDNLGVTYHFQGAQEEALAHHQRALVIREKVHGPDHDEVAHTLNNLGSVHGELGAHTRAEALHTRALLSWEKAHGPEHPEVGRSVLALGDVHASRRAFARALPYYERALAIYERADGEARQLAATRFSLARALWETGGDRTRARQLATMAKEAYGAQRFGVEKDLAEVRAWLATHS